MKEVSFQQLLDEVGSLSGLSMSAQPATATDLEEISFRISGLDSPHGVQLSPFRTALGLGLRTIWDLFSADLILRLEENFSKHREFMDSVIGASENFGVNFSGTANGRSLADGDAPSSSWETVTLTWFVEENQQVDELVALRLLLRAASPALFDLLVGPEAESGADSIGQIEGLRVSTVCGRYERSASNRAACLEHYGAVCASCGMVPEQKYGEFGSAIIHVHHLTPVSQMEEPRRLSPVEDLVPLCPNCHNFAHKRTPPYSPAEIRKVIRRNLD